MKNNRRDFLRIAGLAGAGIAGQDMFKYDFLMEHDAKSQAGSPVADQEGVNLIGAYGNWIDEKLSKELPRLSFRRDEFKDVQKWREQLRPTLAHSMSLRTLGGMPEIRKVREYTYDGLHIEEMTWQLPYGRPTEAILLKPENSKGKLPGILAFHDHGGNKYFGTRKITKTSDNQHPMMPDHQKNYYEGRAWANEIAKRGYVVLVSDSFTFASRRVMLQDVPSSIRQGLTDNDPENPVNITAYNNWAGQHEHIMAKSLFSAGSTWPGVFLAEDLKALDILESRTDVDKSKLGCAGLSGGGLRTALMAGYDNRIKCSVCVGFMTTWRDFLLNKSFTHTWMTYIPDAPNYIDFPEIYGMRVPLPSLVLNDTEDQLFTIGEMKRAEEILKAVYQKAGAPDNFKCSFYPGPHKFDVAMQEEAFNWFDRWLKKE